MSMIGTILTLLVHAQCLWRSLSYTRKTKSADLQVFPSNDESTFTHLDARWFIRIIQNFLGFLVNVSSCHSNVKSSWKQNYLQYFKNDYRLFEWGITI